MPGDRRWRDSRGVARLAQWALYADAAISVAAAALLWTGGGDPETAGPGEVLLWLAQMLVFAAAVLLVLRWIYLANNNARCAGADDMMVRPGWAVAWFFIPLANLVMPYIAMRELWKASVNPRDWQAESASVALPLWWGFWIASGIAGTLSFRMSLEVGIDSGTAVAIELASLLLAVPAALLLAGIVGGIQARLDRHSPGSAEELRDRFA